MDIAGQDFVSLILVSVSFAVTRQSLANVAIQQSFWFLFSQFNTQQDSLIYNYLNWQGNNYFWLG